MSRNKAGVKKQRERNRLANRAAAKKRKKLRVERAAAHARGVKPAR